MQEMSVFNTSSHAKCILAGEHAVLRGCPAIVVPLHNVGISLRYEQSSVPINIECHSLYEDNFLLFFWGTFKQGLERLHKNQLNINGKFYVENNIPIGAGMGFSSALCLVLTRWFIWKHWVRENKLFQFAKQFENLFHGQSSGADVAGAISDHIIHFEKSGVMNDLEVNWHPKLYLSYSGCTKNTTDAITHVHMFRKTHPHLAKKIDEEMRNSVEMIEQSLKLNEKYGLAMLASAISHANHCFEEWGLVSPTLKDHMDELQRLGAIAVKPTGAGIGGYVISLWDKTPNDSKIDLMPIHLD